MTEHDERTVKYSVARRFIVKLGIIAHGYGPSAARLESYLTQVIESLGYSGVFRSTRSEIMYAFWKDDAMDQIVHVEKVEKGAFNMAKLARVGELVESVVDGGISLDDAYSLLHEIDDLPNPWGPFAKAVSFLFIGVGFSGLMSGNIWDISGSSFVEEDAKLNSFSSLKNMAVGSGFGARLDFNFLILRLDVGFKTYEPYLKDDKWFKSINFSKATYNIGINYPF